MLDDKKLINSIIALPEVQEELVDLFSFYMQYLGVKMNTTQLYEEIHDDRLLFLEYLICGDDTDIRERLCDNHTQRILKRRMPCYGDGEEVGKQFWKDLESKHKELGYEVVSDE